MPDQFANPANPLAHYETSGVEILNDFPYDKIDYLIAGIGTGGTIVGVTKRLKEKYPQMRTIGVEPPPGDCIQGLRCLETFIPPVLDTSLIDEVIEVADDDAILTARRLASIQGLLVGTSSGANVWASIQAAKKHGEEKTVATILADRAERYFSTALI